MATHGLGRYYVVVKWERPQEFKGPELAEVFAMYAEEAENIVLATKIIFNDKTVSELGGVAVSSRLLDMLEPRFVRWVGGGIKAS